MTKKIFLDELRDALKENNMTNDIIENNIRYYDEYISDKLDSGVDIDDIMSELGSGRLIAKTIVEADKKGAKSTYYNTSSIQNETNSYKESKKSDDSNQSIFKLVMNNMEFKSKIKGLAIILGVIAVIIILAVVTFKIVAFLLPFAAAMFVVSLVLRFLFSRK